MRRLLVPALILGAALTANAQYMVGVSAIGISGGSVNTYSATEMDYATSLYYDAEADGFIWQNGTSVVTSGYGYGSPTAEVYLSTPATLNTGFMIQTNHWLIAYYYYWNGSGYTYVDEYGYGFISAGNYGGNSGNINAPDIYQETLTQAYYVGSTYVTDDTYPPSIAGINVIGSPVRGSSGYVEVYGSYLAKYAGPTTCGIDGAGVSCSLTYQNIYAQGQVNLSYNIATNANTGPHNLWVTTPFGTSNAVTFTVDDPTPVITGISPNVWPAGTVTSFTISGSGFGSNPSLSISGTGILGYNGSGSDTSITGSVTISPDAPSSTATVTVASNGYGGNNFQPAPQGGSTNQGSTNAQVAAIVINMKLEQVGPTVISTDGKYSEDTTIRVTAVRQDTGATVTTFVGTVNIAEDNTAIYTQNGGSLPASVTITSGGAVTFVAKSLAGPKGFGASGSKPDPALIKTTNYPMYSGTDLSAQQWIISGQQIDPHASGQVYDWFQARARDIFSSATGDVRTILSAVSSYTIAALNAQGQTNWTNPPTAQSSIVLNPYYSMKRTDTVAPNATQLCGQTITKSFTDTLFHEARHAYQASQAAIANNDQDGDFLVRSMAVAPTTVVLDTTNPRTVCNDTSGYPGTTLSVAYHGDGTADSYGAPDNAGYAFEMDSQMFSSSHE